MKVPVVGIMRPTTITRLGEESGQSRWANECDDRHMDEDPPIPTILDRLRSDVGPHAFDVLDYWNGDLCAVGIACPSGP